MTAIRLKENEPFEVAIRRFKRTVEKTHAQPNPAAKAFLIPDFDPLISRPFSDGRLLAFLAP